MKKLPKYLLYTLFVISIIVLVVFLVGLGSNEEGVVALMLNWSYVLLAIAIIATFVLPVMFPTGKGAKGALVKVGILVVLCVICYLCGSGDPLPETASKTQASASTLKWTDAGLILSGILTLAAFLLICFGSFINSLRK